MKNNLKTIHKIDIWSFSKLYGLFGLLMGIITGILNVLATKAGATPLPEDANLLVLFILNVAGYTILLFLGALIFSIFYNAYAKNGRGIKVELE
ncbi:MAG TPA: hypothetical protein VJB87_05085 [Candidatus Nanoarchaeia archaeon]|nr:hypothetical protein [Candidatus Nanoarchaeia archaeon]